MHAKGFFQNSALAQSTFQCRADHAGLFVNFFRHVMAIAALVDIFSAHVDSHRRAHHNVVVGIPQAHGIDCHFNEITFFQEDEAVCHRPQREHVRGDEVFADADAYDQRATGSRSNNAIRFIPGDDAKAKGTFQQRHGLADCLQQIRRGFALSCNQMRHDFGVGLRIEHITLVLQLLAQCRVVFDDAVVHQHQLVS